VFEGMTSRSLFAVVVYESTVDYGWANVAAALACLVVELSLRQESLARAETVRHSDATSERSWIWDSATARAPTALQLDSNARPGIRGAQA
jgi:hypothetical protein